MAISPPPLIFVGPSLRAGHPPRPGVDFAPPARRGDLVDAADRGVRVIGLIDGLFGQDLAVTPREVRQVAGRGVRLYGAASMGALRACECPTAMIGVGAIYQAFARAELTDDDEVAVTFDPTTCALVAYPLVQVREAARLAGRAHPGAQAALGRFVDGARALPFVDRTLAGLRAAARDAAQAGVSWAELEALLTDPRHDVKRRDALALVDLLAPTPTP